MPTLQYFGILWLRYASYQKSLRIPIIEYLMSITQGFSEKCPNISLDIDISQLRDIKDYHILAAAVSAQAKVLKTGDQDLLVLNKFADISIMKPTEFLDIYFPSS